MSSEAEATKTQCAVPACPRAADTRGLCGCHYSHRRDESETGQLVRRHILPSRRGRKRQPDPRTAIDRTVGPSGARPASADQAAVGAIREVLRLLNIRWVDLPTEIGHAFIGKDGVAVLRADGTLTAGRLNIGA
jgi:hypothetical protein